MLHIGNGSSATSVLELAKIPGLFLAWDDILNEGPVPDLPLDAMSQVRADYISSKGWGNKAGILKRFQERDRIFKQAAARDEVVIWCSFELLDQLQLLQILDWYQTNSYSLPQVIFLDNYMASQLQPEVNQWFARRKQITAQQIELASKAWSAFKQPELGPWARLLLEDLQCLPFLRSAIVRLLLEFPGSDSGLSLTERRILVAVASGLQAPAKIFRACQEQERPAFMGDWSFWVLIADLAAAGLLQTSDQIPFRHCPPEVPEQRLKITRKGEAVLQGQLNRLDLAPLDRWIGGVHLCGPKVWCWDQSQKMPVKREVFL